MEKADNEIAELIAEYLTSRGYLQTVASFQTELQHRPRQQATPTQTAGLQSEFLVAFECGERAAFFDLWNRNIPHATLERDPTCQNLEFHLSVYFAIYPIRTGIGDKIHSFQEFTEYLAMRSAVLARSPELATYCALAYLPDPASHPAFKKLFTESWTLELKSRLVHFLKFSLKGVSSQPKLLSLYLTSKISPADSSAEDVVVLREQLTECQKQYSQRLAEIQASYHTLVGIAMELLDTLESAIAGRTITPESIQNICSRLFGSSLPSAVATSDTLRPPTATSILRQSVLSMRESIQAPVNIPTSTPLPRPPSPPSQPHTLSHSPTKPSPPHKNPSTPGRLDFKRIKTALFSGDEKKTLILQALRWRLTQSLTSHQYHSVMTDYITNDLLGSTAGDTYHAHITGLLQSGSAVIREQLCRLLNAFSSLSAGRSYLAHSPALVSTLCQLLVEVAGEGEGESGGEMESNISRNALGAVQKLSLRRPLQGLMIQCSLPQWAAGAISRDGVSEYVLRYCLALLMNLSLRSAGKRACIEVGQVVLRTLGELLEHEDQEICSYVNGILYSLLSLPQLQVEARVMGMGDMLSSALESSPPELKSQLHYIITQLHSETPSAGATDNSETSLSDDSADEDEEEEEDEEADDVIEGDEDEVAIATTGPVGESLLVQYLITPEGTTRSDSNESTQIMTLSRKVLDAPFMRPVTPQSRPASRALSAVYPSAECGMGTREAAGNDGGQSTRRTSTAAR